MVSGLIGDSMKKLTAHKLDEILGYSVKVNKGVYTIGKSYYYRTISLQSFRDNVIEKLNTNNIAFKYIDHGDVCKSWKAGQNTWQGSHYWIKIELL